MPAALKKICGRCGHEKILSDFFHDTTKRDQHGGICKTCQSEVNQSNKK
jgi:superfamily II helicase